MVLYYLKSGVGVLNPDVHIRGFLLYNKTKHWKTASSYVTDLRVEQNETGTSKRNNGTLH